MISSHGAPDNCVKIWNKNNVKLEGHRMRILQMRIGPERDMVCTISAD